MFFVPFPFRLRSFLSSQTSHTFSLFYRTKLVIQLTNHFLALSFIRYCLTGRGQKAELLERLWKRYGTYGSGMGPTEALWDGYGTAMEALWDGYGTGMEAV